VRSKKRRRHPNPGQSYGSTTTLPPLPSDFLVLATMSEPYVPRGEDLRFERSMLAGAMLATLGYGAHDGRTCSASSCANCTRLHRHLPLHHRSHYVHDALQLCSWEATVSTRSLLHIPSHLRRDSLHRHKRELPLASSEMSLTSFHSGGGLRSSSSIDATTLVDPHRHFTTCSTSSAMSAATSRCSSIWHWSSRYSCGVST